MSPDPLSEIRALIARHWGFRELRPLQEQAIQADLERRDSLVVMPTGGGKSLCYQAPATLRTSETTVVISPLISLMKDQVDHLTAAGVSALRVDSTLSDADKIAAGRELKAGRVRLLFASPERMMTSRFQSFLEEIGVRTFAIDEAHCISHWGHDFRPEYRQLASLRDRFPQATFHAFTATATEPVRDDILEQLKLRNPAVLVGNFDRPNLVYRVMSKVKTLEQVLGVLERHRGQAGIIYCTSRKDVDRLTAQLCDLGFNARRYRAANQEEAADFNTRERKATHDAFRSGACDLVVATVAFGMGIDRSDIRFVLHTGMPKSIEHYQQEAGRAGRDGLEAECVLMHSGGDVVMWKKMAEDSALQGRLEPGMAKHAKLQAEQMNSYAKGGNCRHKTLVEHFGQTFESTNCGACDVCLSEIEYEPESTVVAQKILSCVARVGERFGVGHVADVLRGQQTERAISLGHDKLSTFGLLNDYRERQVKDWIGQLVGEGLLTQTSDEFPVLKLNDDSWQVMKGKRAARLMRAGAATASRRSKAEEVSWDGVDPELFDALRNWRREIASRKGIAPFTIFHDSALRDISRYRPTRKENLLQVSGVGEVKLREYGDEVLAIVVRISREKNLTMDNAIQAATFTLILQERAIPPAAEEAFPHFRKRMSVAEVAGIVGRAESTVRDYLCMYIESERPPSVDAWVDGPTQERIREAAHVHGCQRLKPVFLGLNQEVSYEAIRIVLTFLNTRSGS